MTTSFLTIPVRPKKRFIDYLSFFIAFQSGTAKDSTITTTVDTEVVVLQISDTFLKMSCTMDRQCPQQADFVTLS